MCNMETIRVPSGEGWKRLESLIRYQLDNFSDFELKELTRISIDVKNSNLTEDEKVEKTELMGEILRVMDNFMSISKQLEEGIEIEVEEDKLATFSECIKRQLELSEARLEDFREDRFGWGKRACQTLIDDETIFYNEMDKFLKTLDV